MADSQAALYVANKPRRLAHIPRGLIFVIRVRRPVTTRQSGHLVRHGIDTARCPKIPAKGSGTPGPSAASLCSSRSGAGFPAASLNARKLENTSISAQS